MNIGGIGELLGSALGISGPLYLGAQDRASIKTVQRALNGQSVATRLAEDGIFGCGTDAAVRQFQKSHGLVVDGIVGPKTASALGLSYVARAPLPPKSPPSRAGGPLPPPHPGGGDDSSAIGELAEAVVHGMTAIHHTVVAIIRSLDSIPEGVLDRLTGEASGPFADLVTGLRGAASHAIRGGAAGAQSLGNAINSTLRCYTGRIQQVAAMSLQFVPDILGLSGIVDKIRRMIQKLQNAVNSIIDLVIGAVTGAAVSVFEAVAGIVNILMGVAAEAAA